MTLRRITIVPTEAEAEIICGMLRTESINATYRKSDLAGAWTVGFASGGPVEILVDDSDITVARAILDRHDRRG